MDLLWRHRRGELDADVSLVASNHPELANDVAGLRALLPPRPVPEGARAAGAAGRATATSSCSPATCGFCQRRLRRRVGGRIINIHHSFLPAFAGAHPYHQAYERGVKIIGATAHYVTEELDAGPIIEQDVARVSHREHSVTMIRLGRDSSAPCSRAPSKWHLEDRVLVHGNRTVVF